MEGLRRVILKAGRRRKDAFSARRPLIQLVDLFLYGEHNHDVIRLYVFVIDFHCGIM